MTDEIRQIALRIRGLRDIFGISVETLALECGTDPQTYAAYEAGKADIPVSVLHTISRRFGVELTTLLTGEEPKLKSYCLTRKGGGVAVARRADYSYTSLAYNFIGRKAEPFIVTVDPKGDDDPIHFNSHHGQEFDYVLEGKLTINVNGTEFILDEGDSLFFDSSLPHGMKAAAGKRSRFLACIF